MSSPPGRRSPAGNRASGLQETTLRPQYSPLTAYPERHVMREAELAIARAMLMENASPWAPIHRRLRVRAERALDFLAAFGPEVVRDAVEGANLHADFRRQ